MLSWNILQGGGTRAAAIAGAVVRHRPDIVTLQEFRNGSGADVILSALRACGLRHIHTEVTQSAREHAILIASRFGFDAGPFMPDGGDQDSILEASFHSDDLGFPLTLLAVHFPQKEPQVPLFRQLIKDTPSLLGGETLLIGDLNCGIPFADSVTKTFFATDYLQDMLARGWVDSWRSRNPNAVEYTWISAVKKHGFRYDHALASKSFDARITDINYNHTLREEATSDHSAIILNFE